MSDERVGEKEGDEWGCDERGYDERVCQWKWTRLISGGAE